MVSCKAKKKKYQCDFCDKRFSEKRYALIHKKKERTHPKRYACDCGKTYSCAYGLNRHTESCQDKVSQSKSDKETCS